MNNTIIEYFDRFFPNNIAKLVLEDVKVDLTSYSIHLVRFIKKITGLYFSQTGEIWIVHSIPEFNNDFRPFVIPLLYQYCADIQMIAVSVDIFEQYSELVKNNLLTLYKKYGYGLCTIDSNTRSENPTKIIQLPYVQYMLPELRTQIEEYLTNTYNGLTLRRPPWIANLQKQPFKIMNASELLECIITPVRKNKQKKSQIVKQSKYQHSNEENITDLQDISHSIVDKIFSEKQRQGLLPIFKYYNIAEMATNTNTVINFLSTENDIPTNDLEKEYRSFISDANADIRKYPLLNSIKERISNESRK